MTTNNSQIKVLIIDDEVEFATTLAARLKLRNYSTQLATSGEEGLNSLEKEMPDVVVLDLKMPDLDGLEVLAQLKQINPAVETIILTGHGSFEAGMEGMNLGAFDYLMKPVDLNLLLEKIQKAYQKKSQDSQ